MSEYVPDCTYCRACAIHHMPYLKPGDFEAILASSRMFICDLCGNKRCPHATDHRLACTGSNEPNQPGSSYQQRYFGNELPAQQPS